jgi:pyruvate,orthophosphate dikinase
MNAAVGILTSRGGMTSHAAVVARGMGKCCVAGAGDIKVDYAASQLTCGDFTVKEGEYITLDGSNGIIYNGKVDTMEPQLTGDFGEFMGWVDEFRTMGVGPTPIPRMTARWPEASARKASASPAPSTCSLRATA